VYYAVNTPDDAALSVSASSDASLVPPRAAGIETAIDASLRAEPQRRGKQQPDDRDTDR
jgi:hypothetical protein